MADVAIVHQERHRTAGRRFGYVVAAAVNLVMLWIAHHLLVWGWPAFLTSAFEELLPLVSLSLVATAVVNLIWVCYDPEWLRHVGQIVVNLISLVVAVRTWQVFPFDFSAYSSAWEGVVRVILVLCIVGTAIATVVEFVRLVIGVAAHAPPSQPPPSQPLSSPTSERHQPVG